MTNPTAAMIVIGDEILSGRTRDANMFNLAEMLSGKNISDSALTHARELLN